MNSSLSPQFYSTMIQAPVPPSPRREFIAGSSALVGGALAAPVALPNVASAAGPSDKLKIGFIGCGGRGTGAASQALHADSNVVLHAMGDVFPEKIDKSLESLQ